MGYYDFDYFWTHQEVGGRKLKKSEKERQLFTIGNILKIVFLKNTTNNEQNQLESSKIADNFIENSTKQSEII